MAERADALRVDAPAVDRRPQIPGTPTVWRARADGRGVARIDGPPRSPASMVAISHVHERVPMRLWPGSLDWGRLTAQERDVYEVGFLMGFLMREDEVEQANADADRYYRAAFDRQHGHRA